MPNRLVAISCWFTHPAFIVVFLEISVKLISTEIFRYYKSDMMNSGNFKYSNPHIRLACQALLGIYSAGCLCWLCIIILYNRSSTIKCHKVSLNYTTVTYLFEWQHKWGTTFPVIHIRLCNYNLCAYCDLGNPLLLHQSWSGIWFLAHHLQWGSHLVHSRLSFQSPSLTYTALERPTIKTSVKRQLTSHSLVTECTIYEAKHGQKLHSCL